MNQYYQTNWINGMKIHSGHFIDLENHFISRIRNTASSFINDISYGIIPVGDIRTNYPRFSISLSQNKIRVLNNFIMTTPGGEVVQVPEKLEFPINRPTEEASFYYLVMKVSSYSRMPFGDLNEQENPVRYPNSIPEYEFHFLPPNPSVLHSFGNSVIPVGKYTGSSLDEDLSYIPPCADIRSHINLYDLYKDILSSFNELERKVLDLVKNPKMPNRPLLVELISFLDYNKTAVDWYLVYQPPVFLFEKVQQLAKIFLTYYEISSVQIKDDLKSMLKEMANHHYDHLEIYKSVVIARNFLKNYMRLLPKIENIFGV
jgi:hypothetical protein